MKKQKDLNMTGEQREILRIKTRELLLKTSILEADSRASVMVTALLEEYEVTAKDK